LANAYTPRSSRCERRHKDNRKVNQTLRIDADVLEAYLREGKGCQTRINDVLRPHMPQRPR